MAINSSQRGFALLVAVVFMSVMLAFGLALSSLAYKQSVLSSSAVESQSAFYAADAGLECTLYGDQKLNLYASGSSATTMPCDGVQAPLTITNNATYVISTARLSLDSNTRCADVTVYKPTGGSGSTYLFSQGYSISCVALAGASNGVRFTSRGIQASY